MRLLVLFVCACHAKSVPPPDLIAVDNTNQASDFNLLPVSGQFAVFAGGVRSVTVTVERLGTFSVPITFSADGLPAGVTVAPVTIDATATSATLVLSGAAGAAASEFANVNIKATAGGIDRQGIAQVAVLRASVATAPAQLLAGVHTQATLAVALPAGSSDPTFACAGVTGFAVAHTTDWALDFVVPPATAAGDLLLSVHVDALGASVDVPLTVPVSRTVDVTVTDQDHNVFAGATVSIGATTLISAANGHALFTDVAGPYLLRVSGPNTALFMYEGVSRRDPTALLDESPTYQVSNFTATIDAAVPATGVVNTLVFAGGIGSAAATIAPSGAQSTVFNYSWSSGESTIIGNLRYLEWSVGVDGFPQTYTRYGAQAGISVSTTTSGTFALPVHGGISAVAVTGSVTLPTGFGVSEIRMYETFLQQSDRIQLIQDNTNTSTSFSYNMPVLAGGVYDVWIAATKGQEQLSRYVQNFTSGQNVAFDAGPALLEPLASATGVFNTSPFHIGTSAISPLTLIAINCNSCPPGGGGDLRIFTPRTQFSMIDFPEAVLAPSGAFDWTAGAELNFQAADDALGPAGIHFLFEETGDVSHELGFAVKRAFTSAP